MRHLDEKDFAWNTLREPFFIPENKKLDNLLKDFQRMKPSCHCGG
jgi:Mg2+/Co2+ transporter CorC